MNEVYVIETWSMNGFGVTTFYGNAYTDKNKAERIAKDLMYKSNRKTIAHVRTLKVIN